MWVDGRQMLTHQHHTWYASCYCLWSINNPSTRTSQGAAHSWCAIRIRKKMTKINTRSRSTLVPTMATFLHCSTEWVHRLFLNFARKGPCCFFNDHFFLLSPGWHHDTYVTCSPPDRRKRCKASGPPPHPELSAGRKKSRAQQLLPNPTLLRSNACRISVVCGYAVVCSAAAMHSNRASSGCYSLLILIFKMRLSDDARLY